MASRGSSETQRLQQNLEEQLDRLVSQLADLEECRAELEESEYEEARADTIEQLNEFKASLSRMTSGDITLVDSINAMQLAIQAAISQAFKTPEVIQMFAKKQPDQLRQKLSEIDRDHKIGKLNGEIFSQQKVEILSALRKLGETLTPVEQTFLESHSSDFMKNFDQLTQDTGASQKALDLAREGLQ